MSQRAVAGVAAGPSACSQCRPGPRNLLIDRALLAAHKNVKISWPVACGVWCVVGRGEWQSLTAFVRLAGAASSPNNQNTGCSSLSSLAGPGSPEQETESDRDGKRPARAAELVESVVYFGSEEAAHSTDAEVAELYHPAAQRLLELEKKLLVTNCIIQKG